MTLATQPPCIFQDRTRIVTPSLALMQGLSCLHAIEVVHMNLQPSNILLDEHDWCASYLCTTLLQ
jgi:serine/threonine protein kinase